MLHTVLPTLLAALQATTAVASDPPDTSPDERNEVIVLGMIHGDHRTSEPFGLEDLEALIRAIDPEYVLTEIPPAHFVTAVEQFQADGTIEEPRVRVFPEYVDVLFPLTREMDFEIIPCAGWTREMADDRRAKLEEWRTTRPDETAEVERAQQEASRLIEAGGGSDNPRWIHTDEYDEIVRDGMEPYDRLFNEDLGAGGWTSINAAHYALIEGALNEHRGEGVRFLITFGAWHKYWFLDQLRERDDIELIDAVSFLEDG